MGTVSDANGVLAMNWKHDFQAPAQFFGFVWDIYRNDWILGGLNNSIFFQYPAGSSSGQIPLPATGGYHAWVSAQYFDGSLFLAENPWTGIAFSGMPHRPVEVTVTPLETGPRNVQLRWSPELFGTWQYQIIAFKIENLDTFEGVFVPSNGPFGNPSFWHIIDFGESVYSPDAASFFEGWADSPPNGRRLHLLHPRRALARSVYTGRFWLFAGLYH